MLRLFHKNKKDIVAQQKPKDKDRLSELKHLTQARYSQFCATSVFAESVTGATPLWNWLEARENSDKTWSIMSFFGEIDKELQTVITMHSQKMANRQNIPFWQVLETLSAFEQGSLSLKDDIVAASLKKYEQHHFHDVARTEGCVLDIYGSLHLTQDGIVTTEGSFSTEEVEKTREAISKRPVIHNMKTDSLSGYFMSLVSLVPQEMADFTPDERNAIEKERLELHLIKEKMDEVKSHIDSLFYIYTNFENIAEDQKRIDGSHANLWASAVYIGDEYSDNSRYSFRQSEMRDHLSEIGKIAKNSLMLEKEKEKIETFIREMNVFGCVLSAQVIKKTDDGHKRSYVDHQIEKLSGFISNKAELAIVQNHIMRNVVETKIPDSITGFFTAFDEWHEKNANYQTLVFTHREAKNNNRKIKKADPEARSRIGFG